MGRGFGAGERGYAAWGRRGPPGVTASPLFWSSLAVVTASPVGGTLGPEDRVRLALAPGRRLRRVLPCCGTPASSPTGGLCPLRKNTRTHTHTRSPPRPAGSLPEVSRLLTLRRKREMEPSQSVTGNTGLLPQGHRCECFIQRLRLPRWTKLFYMK